MIATRSPRRQGFSLFDLLVVIAILAILAGLMVPAFQRALVAADRLTTGNNLRQVGLALHLYHSANGTFPLGYDAARTRSFYYSVAEDIEAEMKMDAVGNNPKPYAVFLCVERRKVADVKRGLAPADFGYAPSNGMTRTVLGGTTKVALQNIKDGPENTLHLAVISVKPEEYGGSKADSPWNTMKYARDNRAFITDTSKDAGPPRMGSPSKTVTPALFAGGSVRNVSHDIDDKNMGYLWTYDAKDDKKWDSKTPAP